jgi:hypothetical protein
VTTTWACHGNRMPTAAPLVKPQHPSRPPRCRPLASPFISSFFLPLCPRQSGKLSRHCRHQLWRAHTRSPPHHRIPNLANSSTLNPSTPSSAPHHKPSKGGVALLVFATVVPRQSSSVRLLTMAKVLRSPSSRASRCAGFGVVRGCSPWV